MGILERNQAVFVQKVDGPGAIKFNTYIGKRSELHCTGVGKVLLAFQPDEQIELLLSTYSFGRFTKKTISSKSAFLSELARVQQSGYSIDDEEEELGIRCIAAPILSGSNALAAVSVTGTAAQLRTDGIHRVIALTKCAAERISAAALTMSCSA
jgi:IclR family KDG regulon transcriptional repressor